MPSLDFGLAALVASSAPAPVRAQLETVADLEAKLRALYLRGRAAWPELDVAEAVWAHHLARHLPPQVAVGLDALHEDFYLAVAVTSGAPGAVERFCRAFRPKLLTWLTRTNDRPRAEEVVAAVEARLLSEGPEGGHLARYSGRGPLERFVRAVAANVLLNQVRGVSPEPLTDAVVESLVEASLSPELASVARDARRTFTEALRAAFETLSPRERLLLRMHAVESATIDDLGRVYGVHKVTAFRWLEEARLRLRNGTRRHLRDAFRLDEAAIDSLLGGSDAMLDVSLKTLFATVEPAARR